MRKHFNTHSRTSHSLYVRAELWTECARALPVRLLGVSMLACANNDHAPDAFSPFLDGENIALCTAERCHHPRPVPSTWRRHHPAAAAAAATGKRPVLRKTLVRTNLTWKFIFKQDPPPVERYYYYSIYTFLVYLAVGLSGTRCNGCNERSVRSAITVVVVCIFGITTGTRTLYLPGKRMQIRVCVCYGCWWGWASRCVLVFENWCAKVDGFDRAVSLCGYIYDDLCEWYVFYADKK